MLDSLTRRRFLALFATTGFAFGTTPARAIPSAGEVGARLDATVRAYVAAEEYSGAALVVRGGETLLRAGYGIADRITGAPNTPETAYQIASLTKPFTAFACVQLAEAGQLSWDEPITSYLPEVVHAEHDGVEVTLRHLLAHTSGVPDFLGFYDVNNPLSYPRTFEALLDDIRERELEFTPGTRYAYSNSNYIYAGMIIERIAGQSYEAYLREHVFDPAGMTSTFLFDPPDPAPLGSRGYGFYAGQLVATSDFGRVDLAWAAGGLSSTVDDLYRWHEALRTETLASHEAIAAMYEPVIGDSVLGWQVETIAGHRSVGHTGHTIGYNAKLARFLEDDVAIIVLSNFQSSPIARITEDLAEIVFGD